MTDLTVVILTKNEEKNILSVEDALKGANDIIAEIISDNAQIRKYIRENALKYGAKGVGLCRTEHMFMDPNRLPWVQKMIIAKNKEEREEATDDGGEGGTRTDPITPTGASVGLSVVAE